jgi:hypothetical protein
MAKKKLYERLLTVFGDIKVFRYPLFLVYDPGSYQVKGDDVREALDVLQPGDILLRSYSNYLDGRFIPGVFSHAAVYAGELREADRASAGARIGDSAERERAQREMFRTGKQMVIHAMAEGVFIEDILTFSRCDQMAILRLPDTVALGNPDAKTDIDDGHLTNEERAVQRRLRAGESVTRSEITPLIVAEAVRNLGRSYDFRFNFTDFDRLSCSELVYFCYKAVNGFVDVRPRAMKVLFFFTHRAIPPDAFLNANLVRVWASRSVRSKHAGLNFPDSTR